MRVFSPGILRGGAAGPRQEGGLLRIQNKALRRRGGGRQGPESG